MEISGWHLTKWSLVWLRAVEWPSPTQWPFRHQRSFKECRCCCKQLAEITTKKFENFIGAIFGRKKLRSSAKIFKKIIFDLFFKQVSLIFAASENQRSFWRFSKFSKKALKERKNQRTKTERNRFSSETILCCYFCPSEGLILKNLHIRNVYAADVKRIGIKLF